MQENNWRKGVAHTPEQAFPKARGLRVPSRTLADEERQKDISSAEPRSQQVTSENSKTHIAIVSAQQYFSGIRISSRHCLQ